MITLRHYQIAMLVMKAHTATNLAQCNEKGMFNVS